MSDLKRTGGCLCGEVKYEITLNDKDIHVCHCNICQKWHGGPGIALGCQNDWAINGEEKMTWFDSSEWAQRSFCKKCGTHLLFQMKDGSYFGVAVGSLDKTEGLAINSHIFIDKKPDYYDFADNCPRLTEKEFLEMVGAAE